MDYFNVIFNQTERQVIFASEYKKLDFLNLFSDWIDEVKKRIKSYTFFDRESINISLNELKDQLILLCEKVLYIEYRVFLDQNSDEKQDSYREFIKKLTDAGYRKYLYDEYPILFELSYKYTNDFVVFLNEITSHYNCDRFIIDEIFNITDGLKIKYIRTGLGDRHNNGKTVSYINFHDDRKIIYKPRNLSIEIFFYDFIKYYNAINKTQIFLPKTIAPNKEEDYGWIEYIEKNNPVVNGQQLHEAIGHLICILYIFNASDFHFDNIIICEKGIVLIDCETLFNPMLDKESFLHLDVMKIGILPQIVNIGGQMVNIGGFQNGQKQHLNTKNETIAFEAGNLILEEQKLAIFSNLNDFINYKIINTNQDVERILMGFDVSYNFFIKNKDFIISKIKSIDNDTKLRYLIRNTISYSHILDRALSPILLTNKRKRQNFIKKIKTTFKYNSNRKIIFDSEINQLFCNDIPYFYCKFKSTSLYSYNGLFIKKNFKSSPFNNFISKINSISILDLERQKWIIKGSFLYEPVKSSKQDVEKIEKIKKTIEKIYGFFIKNSFYNDKICIYYNLIKSYDKESSYILEKSNITFVSGMVGDLLFLKIANKIFPDENIRKFNLSLENKIQNSLKTLYFDTKIGINGLAGILYTYIRLYKLTEEKRYLQIAIDLLEHNDISNTISKIKNHGLSHGSSGLLIIVIELYKITNQKKYLKIAKLLYNKIISSIVENKNGNLYWNAEYNSKKMFGAAHGTSGIVLSLLKYYEIIPDETNKMIIKKAILTENKSYNMFYGNWKDNRDFIKNKEDSYSTFSWAHGAPGIGLVRLELIKSNIFRDDEKFISILKSDLSKSLIATLKNLYMMNDTLINGKYGNIEFILNYYNTYSENYKLKNELIKYINIDLDDINFVDNNLGLLVPGLLTGISGVGYQLLRLGGLVKESLLIFEI